jgi:hypothetical protein
VPSGPYTTTNGYLGIAKQASKGTGLAPATFLGFTDAVDLDHQQTINRLIEGGRTSVSFSEKVSHFPTGKATILGRPQTLTKAFAYLLGVDTVGAPVSAVYPHVITDDLVTDYLSVEQNQGSDAIERFVDCLVSEISVTFDPQQRYLRATVTWMGGTPTWQASPTSTTFETDLPFAVWDGAFTVDGTVRTNLRNITITARFICTPAMTTNVLADALVKLRYEVEVQIVQLMNAASDEYRLVHYGSSGGTVTTKIATPGSLIADYSYGAAGTARGVKFDIPSLTYDTATYTPLDPNGDLVEVTRHAMAQKGASPLLSMTGKTLDVAAYV